MTVTISVSLPAELVAHARRAVRAGRAPSLSAYIADALAQAERTRSMAGLVADMLAEDGRPCEDDYIWARRALGAQ
jgi:antitoxin ParD1/3/4